MILKAWYGRRAWRLIPFDDRFKYEIRKAACKLDHLSCLNIANADYDVGTITCQLWDVIGNLTITNAHAKIVSGTYRTPLFGFVRLFSAKNLS